MASPKLFAMNATRWLSGEMSARSPKCVSTSMFEGKCCSGSSGDLWPKGSNKQEETMRARVRTGKSYHPRSTRHLAVVQLSISSAIFNIALTLFQFLAVPLTFSNFSTCDHGSLDLPAPSGK